MITGGASDYTRRAADHHSRRDNSIQILNSLSYEMARMQELLDHLEAFDEAYYSSPINQEVVLLLDRYDFTR